MIVDTREKEKKRKVEIAQTVATQTEATTLLQQFIKKIKSNFNIEKHFLYLERFNKKKSEKKIIRKPDVGVTEQLSGTCQGHVNIGPLRNTRCVFFFFL